MPSATADRAFATAVYGDHPYGHLAIGTMAALEHMTLDDVRDFHSRAYQPADAVLIVVGDLSHDQAREEAAASFGAWVAEPSAGRVVAACLDAPEPATDRLLLVDRAGAAQSELRIGHVAVSRRTPDYHALVVGNLVLGGQFVSRLNMNLRERKGYTYGARSWFEFRLGPGPFQMSASVQTEVTAEAIVEAVSEMSSLRGARPITRDRAGDGAGHADEGLSAQLRDRRSNRALGGAAGAVRAARRLLCDLRPAHRRARPRHEVQDAASRNLHPEQLVTVIVGDAERVAPTLGVLDLGPPARIAAP